MKTTFALLATVLLLTLGCDNPQPSPSAGGAATANPPDTGPKIVTVSVGGFHIGPHHAPPVSNTCCRSYPRCVHVNPLVYVNVQRGTQQQQYQHKRDNDCHRSPPVSHGRGGRVGGKHHR